MILTVWEWLTIVIAVVFAIREWFFYRRVTRLLEELLGKDGKNADTS